MRKIFFLLFMSFLVGYGGLNAQTLKVSGTVTDANTGEALPGASVVLKSSSGGTVTGTVTDVDGNYSITAPKDAVLLISFVSYQSQSVDVKGRSVINVKLAPNVQNLSEVVVTAYGTAKKPLLTTAQTGVSAKQMDETVNTTIEQAIQGRAAGVYMTQNSGQPGGGISVSIRGVNSLTGTNEPLYVIDGVQISVSADDVASSGGKNPLSGLNPSDIADIQILQGPSAAALYGSKATNGVILVTTKRGKTGDIQINYGYQLTNQQPPKHLPMMNLSQYAEMYGDYVSQAGGNTPNQFLDPSLLGTGTDWQKELFRSSNMYKHQLSLSGGSDKLTY